MSGVVKGAQKVVKNVLFPKKSAPAAAAPAATSTAAATGGAAPAAERPRVAMPEEIVTKLRRRRGSRTLLSQERMDAESGLAGEQTTLGGM